jgi:SAM-dependent methyltransferase
MGSSAGTKLVGRVHGQFVSNRRIAVLAEKLAIQLSPNTCLLDVGCGDGTLAARLAELVSGLKVQGVEVSERPVCAVECQVFDGAHLPFPDESYDVCLLVDVLHHTTDPSVILREACRVSREFVLMKDHLAESALDHWTLRLMDWVGNRPHGVVLPYNYLPQSQWNELYRSVGVEVVRTERRVPLYPFPFSTLFGRNLHFISLLRKQDK